LVEPIVAAKNPDAAVFKNFVTTLLERERSIFGVFTKCRRTLDVVFKECRPTKIEPLDNRLHALASDRFPVRIFTIAKFGQMRFQFSFRQPFSKKLVGAILERDSVIPDLCGNVDSIQELRLAIAREWGYGKY
jgi:hypothetical protein